MVAHDQETQQQENRTTAEGTTHRRSEDRNSPVTDAENQPITAEHPA